jgi:hypothetical protein
LTTLIEYYDIHHLVSIRVHRRATIDLIPEISQPFRYFQVARLEREPDIILEVGDFEPDNHGCYLVDHQFYVRENYLYCEDAYRSARWRVEIKGFEYGQTHIRISGVYKSLKQLVSPGMFWESLLLKQVVALHLSRKGYFLVHGAAAARKGQALVLFGRGGTYKTTLLMTLLRQNKGWLMLGDDTVIVGAGQVFSFPALAGFFAFRYKYLPTESLGIFDRIRLLLFLTRFTSKELPIIADKGRLAGLVECGVGSGTEVSLDEVDRAQNLARLVKVSAAEDHSNYNIGHTSIYPRYVEAYTYVFPGNLVAQRWQNACEKLLTQTKNAPSLSLGLPNTPRSRHFSEAIAALENRIAR